MKNRIHFIPRKINGNPVVFDVFVGHDKKKYLSFDCLLYDSEIIERREYLFDEFYPLYQNMIETTFRMAYYEGKNYKTWSDWLTIEASHPVEIAEESGVLIKLSLCDEAVNISSIVEKNA